MEELDKSKSGNPIEGEARGKMSIEEFLAKDEQKRPAPFPDRRFSRRR